VQDQDALDDDDRPRLYVQRTIGATKMCREVVHRYIHRFPLDKHLSFIVRVSSCMKKCRKKQTGEIQG
jgi:hypothetical protein